MTNVKASGVHNRSSLQTSPDIKFRHNKSRHHDNRAMSTVMRTPRVGESDWVTVSQGPCDEMRDKISSVASTHAVQKPYRQQSVMTGRPRSATYAMKSGPSIPPQLRPVHGPVPPPAQEAYQQQEHRTVYEKRPTVVAPQQQTHSVYQPQPQQPIPHDEVMSPQPVPHREKLHHAQKQRHDIPKHHRSSPHHRSHRQDMEKKQYEWQQTHPSAAPITTQDIPHKAPATHRQHKGPSHGSTYKVRERSLSSSSCGESPVGKHIHIEGERYKIHDHTNGKYQKRQDMSGCFSQSQQGGYHHQQQQPPYHGGHHQQQHCDGYQQQQPHYGDYPQQQQHYGDYPQQQQHYGDYPQQQQHYGDYPEQQQHYGDYPQQQPHYEDYPQHQQHYDDYQQQDCQQLPYQQAFGSQQHYGQIGGVGYQVPQQYHGQMSSEGYQVHQPQHGHGHGYGIKLVCRAVPF